MRPPHRPFRVALWTLLAAFVLTLLVTVTDPQSVRLAILAKAQQDRAHPGVGEIYLATDGDPSHRPSTDIAALAEPTGLTTGDISEAHADFSDKSRLAHTFHAPDSGSLAATRPEYDSPENGNNVASRAVSSAIGPAAPAPWDADHSTDSGGMPVLTPTILHGSKPRGEFVELPPPSESNSPSASSPDDFGILTQSPSTTGVRDNASHGSGRSTDEDAVRRTDFDHLEQRLHAELAALHREIEQLDEKQKIRSQLDRLQCEQHELLQLHRELPVARLTELLDLLIAEVKTARDAIPARKTTAAEPAQPENGRPPEQRDGETVSLQIYATRLEDLIDMLASTSGRSIVIGSGNADPDSGCSESGRQHTQASRPGPATERFEPPLVKPIPAAPDAKTTIPSLPPLFIDVEPPAANRTSSQPGERTTSQYHSPPQPIRQTASSSRCATCHANRSAY